MKKVLFLLVVVPAALSCSKDKDITQANTGLVTISQGVYGTLLFREGNCMPVIDPNACKEYFVKRKIFIYEAATESDAVPATSYSTFYTSAGTPLVATAESNSSGFFEVSLTPGKYSIFIKEDGKLWAKGIDDQEHIMPVTVTQGTAVQRNIVIDYKAVY
jgi:hypothetical protein